ncbi:MAG: FtsW/RodA/SpoVE family cell cycle protein [Flavobacteriales bacterium]
MRSYLKYLKGDPVIWIITLLMMAFSLVTVYSFVPILIKIEGGSPFLYLFKHLVYVVLGFGAMFVIHRVPAKYISQLAKFAYYVGLALLLFTWFFGAEVNGAGRWIRIPFVNLTFQSSDFAKLALIIYLSKLLVRKQQKFDNWKEGILPLLIPIGVTCFLILKDNFSTAAMLFMLSMIMLFIGRVPILKLLTLGAIGIGLALMVVGAHLTFPDANILPRYDTWMNRINNRVDATNQSVESLQANQQANNAKLAISVGSVFGQGVGDGKLKEFLPEAYADFYYATFVEEFGSGAALVLVFLYLILLYRMIRISLKTTDLFQSYVCMGIGIHLLTQASINMLVCTGVFPVTGQNMPFLAMGGSALVMACISIGVVQSFAKELKSVSKEEKFEE